MGFYQPSATCQIPRLGELYEAVLGQRRDGCFVEVGAFDGDMYSNTSFLADLGWRGIFVEPVPRWAEVCRWRHRANPRVSVLQCAIGAVPERRSIHAAHSFSSFHRASIDRSKAMFRGLPADEILVPFEQVFTDELVPVDVVRLEAVLVQQRILPGFDVLVVDVEGDEAAVFDSFNVAVWRPTLLIVELTDRHPRYAEPWQAELRAKILAAGYAHLYVDAVNTVFERVA
jgi:FkbM family methyltransferase